MKKRPLYYYLHGKIALPWHLSPEEWAQKMHLSERGVALDRLGEVTISTIFLGMDHQWLDGPPLLFETMIFSGDDGSTHAWRCSTYDEAEAMHRQVLAKVREQHAQRQVVTEDFIARIGAK